MSNSQGRVDLEKQLHEIERLRAEMRALPANEPTVTTRAVAKIVQDVHLEGRMGRFTVHSDEPASRGGTELGPSPLQYLMVGVAF
jgi:hypothetical protein